MNRIDAVFRSLKKDKKKALIVYLTAGDQGIRATQEAVLSIARAGADIIELGVPFSDPVADGPTIQAASQRALKNGTSVDRVMGLVSRIRKKSAVPLALMTYYNPVFAYGLNAFVKDCRAVGVDGVIIPDLPPEEARPLIRAARKSDLKTIFLAAPTSGADRLKLVAKRSTGFIYYVSLTGVTGARRSLPRDIKKHIGEIRSFTGKPVCVGFGISTPSQAGAIARYSDGIIVGSALIKVMQRYAGSEKMPAKAAEFVRGLSRAIKSR